tara:strand:+ start:117 stop:638 length:522 start_codon:yes stop_codon:yes gene_type:complete
MADKTELLRTYLSQQADNAFIDGILDPNNLQMHSSTQNIPPTRDNLSETPEDDDLEQFKAVVKYFTKIDNEIREIRAKIKLLNAECNKRKKIVESITPTIMKFMSQNDIDELNSKDGIIRYRKSMIKTPLTQKTIKDKLYAEVASSEDIKTKLDKIFDDRAKVEKESLRRVPY